MTDPSLVALTLPSLVGGLIGGGFAIAGGALTTRRSARNERHRVEREDLVRVAAEMIRMSDAMWVADIDHIRAVTTLGNAERSRAHSEELLQTLREQSAQTRRLYTQANDQLRSLAAEMRLRQPTISAEAEALWRASMVQDRGGAESLNPPDEHRRSAESDFIAKVRLRVEELQ